MHESEQQIVYQMQKLASFKVTFSDPGHNLTNELDKICVFLPATYATT